MTLKSKRDRDQLIEQLFCMRDTYLKKGRFEKR